MTERGNANANKMSVAEFEKRVPANAKLKRMRIEKGMVCFGLGYDKDEKLAVMWNSTGKAFIRPLTKKAVEVVKFKKEGATRFNGWLYHRDRQFDLIDGDKEK